MMQNVMDQFDPATRDAIKREILSELKRNLGARKRALPNGNRSGSDSATVKMAKKVDGPRVLLASGW